MDSLELAKRILKIAEDVKAINPVILDLKDISSFTDYFVIVSASSDRQTRAISDKVELELKKENIRPHSAEGYEQATWIVLDYFDVILHVFTEELRADYDLEGFWNKAKRVKIAAPKKPAAKKKVATQAAVKSKTKKTAPIKKAVKKAPSKVKTAKKKTPTKKKSK